MKKMPILADLHTHLNEKKVNPAEWWEAVKKRKLSIIAITEHSYYKPKEAYLKLKPLKLKKVLLVPGIEVKTTAGDLLVYGEDESIYEINEFKGKIIKAEKALNAVKKYNFAASFAHPYGFEADSVCWIIGEKKGLELAKKFNLGAEYYNGMIGSANQLLFGKKITKKFYNLLEFIDKNRATKKLRINKATNKAKLRLEAVAQKTIDRVRKGILFAQKASFITVGSDAHYPRSIGSSVLELKRKPKNIKEFLEMLRKKEILWAGPNIYSQKPVDHVGKKEMLEGIYYIAKTKILRKGKKRAKKKQGKRIKTIKKIIGRGKQYKNFKKKIKFLRRNKKTL